MSFILQALLILQFLDVGYTDLMLTMSAPYATSCDVLCVLISVDLGQH